VALIFLSLMEAQQVDKHGDHCKDTARNSVTHDLLFLTKY
jgi:hypothetical protein